MNKELLIKELSKKTKLTSKDSKNCVNAMLDIILNSLKMGDFVNLYGFGKLDVVTRKGRYYTNPKNKSKIYVKAKNVIKFKPSSQIKIG